MALGHAAGGPSTQPVSQGFAPNQVSGLAIWLDGSAIQTPGTLSSHPDSTPGPALTTSSAAQAINAVGLNGTNGANGVMTITSPNGKMVTSYTPVNGFYQRLAATTGQYGHTTFAVVQAKPDATERAFYSVGGIADGYQFGFLNKAQRCIRTLGGTVLTTAQIPSWAWEVWVITCDAAHNWRLRVNGIPQTLSATQAAVLAPSAQTTLAGAFPNGGPTNPWAGNIAEVGQYNNVIGDTNILSLEAYLAAKWSLNQPQIIVDGNSIAAGGNGTTTAQSWPAVAAGLLGAGYTVANSGIGGQTTPQMTTQTPLISGPQLSALRPKTLCLGLEFTNDDLTNGASTAVAQANYAAWAQAVASWGGRPIACTYTPLFVSGNVGQTNAFNARRATNNAWLKANYQAIGCFGVVDIGTLFVDADAANAALFGDGLHPTPLACSSIIGPAVATALRAL